MKLLAIETATESCSAALLVDGNVCSVNEIAPRRHNEIILSMCERVLAEGHVSVSQLDAIAFGRGPGAFTGVRLAASVVQGIALGQDLPVVPVSSLAALAQSAIEEKKAKEVLACIDARMQEIYFGLYKSKAEVVNGAEIMQLVGDEGVVAPSLLDISISDACYGLGTGWKPYADELFAVIGNTIDYDADTFPQARHVATLAQVYFQQGKSVAAIDALPVYLRDNVAEKSKKKMVF